MTLAEKRQKRGQLVQQMRALTNKAHADNERSLTAEEAKEWDLLDKEQEKLAEEIRAEEKEAERRSRLASLEGELETRTDDSRIRPQPGGPGGQGGGQEGRGVASSAYAEVINGYLRGELDRRDIRGALEQRGNTLQVDLFTKGGALVMPQQMAEGLLKSIDDETFILQLAAVERVTSADSLGIITLDTDPADADWTSELATGNEGTLTLGKREMRPHPIAKRIKASNTLLRKTAGGAGALVNNRLSYKFGITFEKGCLTGHGAQQPLGVFVAHADGIPTTRDVATGNTTTSMGADGLINAKHSIKSGYWPRLTWVFHRDGISQLRKLKDGNGNYIWQPGLSADLPDRILEVPYRVSEYAPNTFTTGLYVGAIGDFRYYQVVIALDMTIQRLEELYAEANQTGFIGRMEADGQPVLAEAFARVKLA